MHYPSRKEANAQYGTVDGDRIGWLIELYQYAHLLRDMGSLINIPRSLMKFCTQIYIPRILLIKFILMNTKANCKRFNCRLLQAGEFESSYWNTFEWNKIFSVMKWDENIDNWLKPEGRGVRLSSWRSRATLNRTPSLFSMWLTNAPSTFSFNHEVSYNIVFFDTLLSIPVEKSLSTRQSVVSALLVYRSYPFGLHQHWLPTSLL